MDGFSGLIDRAPRHQHVHTLPGAFHDILCNKISLPIYTSTFV